MQWENLTGDDFERAVRETGVCVLAMGVPVRHAGHGRSGAAGMWSSGLFALLLLSFAAGCGTAPAPAPKPPSEAGRPSGILAQTLRLLPPAPAAPAPRVKLKPGARIVALGDSITAAAGWLDFIDGVMARSRPELKLPQLLNAGVPGDCVGDLAARLREDVLAAKPDLVLISVGVNDVGRGLGRPYGEAALRSYRDGLAGMVERAQAAGAGVVLLAPTVIGEDTGSESNRRLALYAGAMRELAAAKKCGFADLHALFRRALEARPAGAAAGGWLTYDGVHMNERGDAVMAIGVLRELGLTDAEIAAGGPE
jgi:lysophospholipase L1-like esterase